MGEVYSVIQVSNKFARGLKNHKFVWVSQYSINLYGDWKSNIKIVQKFPPLTIFNGIALKQINGI